MNIVSVFIVVTDCEGLLEMKVCELGGGLCEGNPVGAINLIILGKSCV